MFSTGLVNELRAAVQTDVVKRANLVLAIPYQQHGFAGYCDRRGRTRLGQLARESREHPGTREQSLVFQLQELGVGVGAVRQRGRLGQRLLEAGQELGGEELLERGSGQRVRLCLRNGENLSTRFSAVNNR